MKLKILVLQVIEVPKDALLDIMETINRKWDNEPDASIHSEEILREAESRGLIELPDQWQVHEDDDFRWEKDELASAD